MEGLFPLLCWLWSRTGLNSRHTSSHALCLWTSDLTSLSLTQCTCRMRVISVLTSGGSFIRVEHNTGALGGVEGHIRSCWCLWGCGGWGGGGLSHLLWVLMYWNVLQCKCLHKNNFLKPSLEMHKNLTCSVHSWGQINSDGAAVSATVCPKQTPSPPANQSTGRQRPGDCPSRA